MKKILLFLIMLAFISCTRQKRYRELTYFNDFEQVSGWFSPPRLVKGPAHSGFYSYQIDSSYVYGLAFRKSFPEISDKKLKKISYSAWLYVKDMNADGKIVMEIQDASGKSVFWNGASTRDFIYNAEEWAEVKGGMNIPPDIQQTKDYYFILYGWDIGKTPFWMDDIEIKFE